VGQPVTDHQRLAATTTTTTTGTAGTATAESDSRAGYGSEGWVQCEEVGGRVRGRESTGRSSARHCAHSLHGHAALKLLPAAIQRNERNERNERNARIGTASVLAFWSLRRFR